MLRVHHGGLAIRCARYDVAVTKGSAVSPRHAAWRVRVHLLLPLSRTAKQPVQHTIAPADTRMPACCLQVLQGVETIECPGFERLQVVTIQGSVRVCWKGSRGRRWVSGVVVSPPWKGKLPYCVQCVCLDNGFKGIFGGNPRTDLVVLRAR